MYRGSEEIHLIMCDFFLSKGDPEGGDFMYFNKRLKEATPLVHASVWMCSEEACCGWMRENFSFDKKPICPLCSSMMEKKMKLIPAL